MISDDSAHHHRWHQLARAAHEHTTRRQSPPPEVFQTSTMAALLSGVYDGDVTIAALLSHGDFGLGTFNGLDGEMVILDGVCYQLQSDGSAHAADENALTPFAVVTYFRPDITLTVDAPLAKPAFAELIDSHVSSANLIYALRVTGHFSRIRTRTVTKQVKPYVPLTEATKSQAESTFTEIDGTLAGFLTPQYEQGISVAGYHLHFLDDTHTRGGHGLDFVLQSGTVQIATIGDLHLSLPRSGAFLDSDLNPETLSDQVRQTEGG